MNDKRKVIANVLRKLYFVNWDRYFGEQDLTFFGWIDREKDNYKDFVTVTFNDDGKSLGISYATSSVEWTKEIAEILNCEHFPCNRVEYFCDLPNIIKECVKGQNKETEVKG